MKVETRFYRHLGSSVAMLSLVAAAGQALAAGVASDDPPALTENKEPTVGNTRLPEIVVTASRQAQSLQKVSAAVEVLDGAKLRDQAVINVAQLFDSVPGVQITTQPTGFSINVRGLGADVTAGKSQGSVANEFDGVYQVHALGTMVGLFDVQRVEVLPGPQSTRYGPNGDGGVVNTITRDPVLHSTGGYATVTVGNYGLVRGEIGQNIPLGDTLAMRISGAAIHRGSYYTPATSNAVAQSGRVKLLWQPDDRLTAKLSYELDHIGGTGPGVDPYNTDKVALYPGDSINNYANPWGALTDSSSNPDTAPSRNTANLFQHAITGNLGYRLNDAMAVDVTTGYVKIAGSQYSCHLSGPSWNVGDGGGPFTRVCVEYHQFAPFSQFSTEARLHNAAGSKIQWNLGYYHFNYGQTSWDYEDLGTGYTGPNYPSYSSTRTNAFYGDITYPITDRLRALAGLRYSMDQRGFVQGHGTQAYNSISLHHVDYRLGEEFDLGAHSMQYFTVSTGYRPGGLKGYDPSVASKVGTFNNEVNTAFEFGLKNRFFNNMLQVNVDAYYYRITGYQNLGNYANYYTSTGTYCDFNSALAVCQIPAYSLKAHSLGFESQIRFAPTRNDDFTIAANWVNAVFDKNQSTCATVAVPTSLGAGCWYGYNNPYTNALSFFNIAGASQPHSPKFSANFAYTHTFRFASGATLAMGGQGYHSASYWNHPVQDATLYAWQPAYWTGDVNVTFTPSNTHWSLSAYMRNVSDYAVKESAFPVASLSDPRTIGLTLNLKW